MQIKVACFSAVSDQVEWAVGVHYDAKMVNLANYINHTIAGGPFQFYIFDIDQDSPGLLGTSSLRSEWSWSSFFLCVRTWTNGGSC